MRDVRVGVAAWCLAGAAEAAIERAAALGFTVVHLDFGTPGTAECLESADAVAAVGRCARAHGVAIDALALNWLNDVPLAVDATGEAREQEAIRSAVAAAASLGAPGVVIPSFERAAIRTEEDLRRHARRVRDACGAAAEAGAVAVASETSLGADDLTTLVRLVDHPRCRILLDTQNPALANHDPVDIVARLPDRLWPAVHVKDGTGGIMGNAALGAGEGGLARTIRAAARAGFARSWMIESERGDADDVWHDDRRRLEAMLRGDQS